MWVLKEEDIFGNLARYDKHSGLLINGTFYYSATDYYSFKFNGKTNSDIGYLTNDYEPHLTDAKVSPIKGNQSTLFNFSVIYTDQDNNRPTQVNLTINETTHQMFKVNSSDNNYTNGCVYHFQAYLPSADNNYSYHFNCSDWKFSNHTKNYTNLEVVKTNQHAPSLLNTQVSPQIWNASKIFNFTVIYKDQDNDLPVIIIITIGASTYQMLPEDPCDKIANDGKKYYYNTTLTNGFYQFEIKAFDGKFGTTSGTIEGPEVNPFYYGVNLSIFEDDFEDGVSKWDSITGLWHLTDTSSSWPNPSHSPTHSMWYGQESSGNYDTGLHTYGELSSVAFDLSKVDDAFLEVFHWKTLETDNDKAFIYMSKNDGYSWEKVYESSSNTPSWERLNLNLTLYCGYKNVRLRFYFDTFDKFGNAFRGWLIDDVKLYSTTLRQSIDLIAPGNESSIVHGSNTFTWKSLEEKFTSVKYTLQISDNKDFSTIKTELNDIAETSGQTSASVSINLARGKYYWRVRGIYQGFNSKWSETCEFSLKTPPGSFKLDLNADDPDTDGTVVLNWSTSSLATSYKIYCNKSYITKIDESVGAPINETTTFNFTVSGLANGTYFFVIVAINKDGEVLSNCVNITVLIQASRDDAIDDNDNDGKDDDETPPDLLLPIVIIIASSSVGGAAVMYFLIKRKKINLKRNKE